VRRSALPGLSSPGRAGGDGANLQDKDTNKRAQCQIYLSIAEREYLKKCKMQNAKCKMQNAKCKIIACFFAAFRTERSQKYELSEGNAKFI